MANPKIEVEIGAITDKLKKGVDGSILSLSQLQKEAENLNKALENATDPADIIRLNQSLQSTKSAMLNLRTAGLEPLTKATSQYNSVGVDFARIIQDAPFGIIGVGNNITQLASSFQVLKNQTGSTSSALKSAFASIFSSGNALILGISALTTAFTILQMNGFFKTGQEAESASEKLDKFKKSLDSSTQAVLEGANNADKEIVKIQALRTVIEDETIARNKRLSAIKQVRDEAPSIFKNLTDEQILAGKVGDAYARLTQILIARATAQSSINKIVQLNDEERTLLEKNAEVIQQIAEFERRATEFRKQGQQELVTINENQIRFLKNQNPELQRLNDIEKERITLTDLVNKNLSESVDFVGKAGDEAENAKDKVEIYDKAWQENEDRLIRIAQLSRQIAESIPGVPLPSSAPVQETAQEAPLGTIQGLQQQLELYSQLRDAQTDTEKIQEYNLKIIELQTTLSGLTSTSEEVNQSAEAIAGAFSALGSAIGSSLNISNNALKGFITTLLTNTPKIIQAIIAQSKARKLASDISVQANAKEAAGEGIALGTKAANALGPVGLALLPVFVGGALALISGAFSKIGGGSSIGGGSVSGGIPKTFGGSGSTGLSFDRSLALTGEFRVKGQDLVYVFNEASSRNAKG